jgi:hypothetical protein
MRTSPTAKPTRRDADNELYDQGCDLVEAAAAIRRAAGEPEAARAIPAVLGCIESALQELLWASIALEQTSVDLVTQNPGHDANPITERMQRGFANLQQALADGERASAAARALAGRAFTAPGGAQLHRRRR